MVEVGGHSPGQKASILDVVVRKALEVGEEDLLQVTEELSSLSFFSFSHERLDRDVRWIESTLLSMENARDRVQKVLGGSGAGNHYGSGEVAPTHMPQLSVLFISRLRGHSDTLQNAQDAHRAERARMDDHVKAVVEYFGEDPRCCGLARLLSSLGTFVKAVKTSRLNAEWESRRK